MRQASNRLREGKLAETLMNRFCFGVREHNLKRAKWRCWHFRPIPKDVKLAAGTRKNMQGPQAMADPQPSVLDTRFDQMFPVLSEAEIGRLRRFGEIRSYAA